MLGMGSSYEQTKAKLRKRGQAEGSTTSVGFEFQNLYTRITSNF